MQLRPCYTSWKNQKNSGLWCFHLGIEIAEAATGGVLWNKVFLKISQENACVGISLLDGGNWTAREGTQINVTDPMKFHAIFNSRILANQFLMIRINFNTSC